MPHQFEVVEDDCIGCGLCSNRAPENLEIPTGTSLAQVFKQPETSEEEEACLEASEYCPMGGLHAGAADLPSEDSSEDGIQPTSIPAGDPTPAGTISIRLES